MIERRVRRTVAVANPRPTLTPRSAGPRGSATFESSDPGTVGEMPDDEDAPPPEADTLLLVNVQVCSAPSG
jgi:hypothetical protein